VAARYFLISELSEQEIYRQIFTFCGSTVVFAKFL
jgi:hypothetical protein